MQDLTAPKARFLISLCGKGGQLTMIGDAGQRIYPGGQSLRGLGIETRGLINSGVSPSAIAIFSRGGSYTDKIREALDTEGVMVHNLSSQGEHPSEAIGIGTMHRAKGLEFRFVFVAGCSDDMLPHRKALKEATDPADAEETLEMERNLLYVSLTRSRDEVFITWTGRPSSFILLKPAAYEAKRSGKEENPQ